MTFPHPGGILLSMATTLTPDIIKKALRAVKDPELGLNIIDIGLVYDAAVTESGDVHVKMTLTSPGCPAGASTPPVSARYSCPMPPRASGLSSTYESK